MAGRFTVDAVFRAIDRVTAPVRRMQNSIGRMARSAERQLKTINAGFDRVNRAMGSGVRIATRTAAIGFGVLTAAIIGVAKAFSTVEDAQAAFTPVLGGVEKAQKLVAMLNETAATTPFQFETLADSTKQLLPNMNNDLEKTIKTLRMLGDTAGGNAQKLDSITRGFNKALLKGKVDMESLNMIAEAGVPIMNDLADVVGVKMGPAFFKMVSAGQITTAQLTKAFERMTSKGGIFFRGMEIASQTQTGLFSTLVDNITLTAAAIGEILSPVIKDLLRGATDLAKQVREWVGENRKLIESKFLDFVNKAKSLMVQLFESVRKLNSESNLFQRTLDAFGVLVDGLIFLGQHGKTIFKIIAAVVALSVAFKALAVAVGVVNFVMALNPLGLIVLALAAVGAAVAAAVVYWDELKAAFLPLADQVKKAWEPVGQFFTDLWSGIVDTFNVAVFKVEMAINKIKSIQQSASRGLLRFTDAIGLTDDGSEAAAMAKAPTPLLPIQSTTNAANERVFEKRTTESSELVIKDQTGRAEMTKGAKGSAIRLERTGGFE